MEKCNPVRILLCGASIAGNLGAQAMYDSIIDELRDAGTEPDVSVLSKYPDDDAVGCLERGYRLVPFPTTVQLTCGLLFYLVGGFLKWAHLPYHWMASGAVGAYFDHDILVDASGIAFTDDRSFSDVLINTLWFLPAIVTGIPSVKVSQSMGPYRKWYVRFFSRLVLRHVDCIVCRGAQSYSYTKAFLHQENIYNLPDSAFCLKPESEEKATALLEQLDLERNGFIAVSPSYVMQDRFPPGGYCNIVAGAIQALHEHNDLPFVLIPHSWRHTKKLGVDSVSNDYTVCCEIANLISPRVRCVVLDRELSAKAMKAFIASAYITIGSRYHFLIAALSSAVPSMALGWSHKYRELFSEFAMEEYVQEYQNMTPENVASMALKLLKNREACYTSLLARLPGVKARSAENEKLILNCLENNTAVR